MRIKNKEGNKADGGRFKKYESLMEQGIPKRLALNMASNNPGDLPTMDTPMTRGEASKRYGLPVDAPSRRFRAAARKEDTGNKAAIGAAAGADSRFKMSIKKTMVEE